MKLAASITQTAHHHLVSYPTKQLVVVVLENGEQDWKLTRKDTGGKKMLIGEDFIYWGGDGPPLPENLQGLIVGRAHKSKANDKYIPDFIKWFEDQKERGCLGLPANGLRPPARKGKGKRRKRC